MRWWRVIRPILAVVILGGVAWHLHRLLTHPDFTSGSLVFRPARLTAALALYLAAMTAWGMYFARLVRRFEPGPIAPILRAYLISHIGKYVPGRALVIIVRTALAYQRGVPAVISAVTTVYETLVSMACGALIAGAVLLASQPEMAGRAMILLAVAGLPIVPGVFDRIIGRLTRRFLPTGHPPPPRLGAATLAEGFFWAALGWLCLGLSLQQTLTGVLPEPVGADPVLIVQLVGIYSLAHVSGFLAFPVPGGLGVREVVLQKMLLLVGISSMNTGGLTVAVALAFRLIHATGDVAMAALLYPWELATRGTR